MTRTFKGSMQPPKYEHGREVGYSHHTGTINHRRYKDNVKEWEYGLVFSGQSVSLGIQWMSEAAIDYLIGDNSAQQP